MKIAITELPKIIDILVVNGDPYFVVLLYEQFVKLVATASEIESPNITSVIDFNMEHTFIVIRYEEFLRYMIGVEINGSVDERHYLHKHNDVNEAIKNGMLRSGTEHYLLQGYFERRDARFSKVSP
jgi:hypothetical protein